MRSIKTAVLSILMLFVFVAPALSAPDAKLSTDKARRFASVSFSDLKNVSKVSYLLYYDTARGQKGLEGGFSNKSKIRSTTRRQILGTCSSGRCVYHQGVKNITLEATFFLRSGQTTTVTKNLR